MTKKDLFFFRLDATQTAVIIGLFEILTITSVYFAVGAVYGVVVQVAKDNADDYYKQFMEAFPVFDEMHLYGVMGAIFIIFLTPLMVPLLLLIGALKGNRCMMVPWIIVGCLRVILGTVLMFFAGCAFPIGSCAQVFFFASNAFSVVTTVYSINAVCSSYVHMHLIQTQNVALVDSERLPYHNF